MELWETELYSQISNFSSAKKLAEEQKKVADKLNKQIKAALMEHEIDKFSSDKFIVTMTEISNDCINESTLIPKLKERLSKEEADKVIKVKEYIDNDTLEDLIYNKKISPDIIAECIIHKEPTLRLNIKENKNNG